MITIARIMSGIFGIGVSTQVNGGTPNAPVDTTETDTLFNGSGASKATILYSAEISLGSNDNEPIDLTSLTDQLGNSISFASVKYVWIKNTGAEAVDVDSTIASMPLSGLSLKPGQHIQTGSPETSISVTSITKTIDLTAGSSGSTVAIVILGN